MSLEAQWRRMEAELPQEWADAQLALDVPNPIQRARAAALLGPANPGRSGSELRFAAHRRGTGTGPEAVRRLLKRLDDARIRGDLRLVGTTEIPPEAEVDRAGIAQHWDQLVAALPPDWSDLLLRDRPGVERLPPAGRPAPRAGEPGQDGERLGASGFRVARRFGYGASPEMTRRCLERLDEEGIAGHVAVLRALSDTHNVATQGPVWYLEGKAV